MRAYNFFTTVHLDRFSDLDLVVMNLSVVVEPYSFGEDGTVEVHIKGEAGVTQKLDWALQKIKHILSTAPVVEEV